MHIKGNIVEGCNNMNILMTGYYFDGYHGSMMHLCEISEYLVKKNCSVDIVSVQVTEEIKEYVESQGINLYTVDSFDAEKIYDYALCYHYPILPSLLEKGIDIKKIIFGSLSGFVALESPSMLINSDLILQVHSQSLKEEFIRKYNFNEKQIYVMPNLVPDKYFSIPQKKLSKLQKVAVVSNHVPEEIREVKTILKQKSILVDFYGMADKYIPLSPSILKEYDCIITIGKTVQYALALGIPVYNYDHFGGSGYITIENLEEEEFYNFSGRSSFRKLDAEQIVEEVVNRFHYAKKQSCELRLLAKKRYLLSDNIEKLFKFAARPFIYNLDDLYTNQISFLTNTVQKFMNDYQKTFFWANSLDFEVAQQKNRIMELATWGQDQELLLNEKKRQIEELSKWGDSLEALLKEKDAQIENLSIQNNVAKDNLVALQGKIASLEQQKLELDSNWSRMLSEKESVLQTKYREIENLLKVKDALQAIADQRERELLTIRSNKIYQQLVKVYKWLKRLKAPKIKNMEGVIDLPAIKEDSNALVSVIIPVYNNAAYLEQCFESVRKQTYKNIEVIIVDDCSPDSTVRDILRRYEGYSNFYIYYNDINSGICETTNKAMCKANGEWFAFLDCDDWLDEAAIEKMYNCLKNKPGAVFGYSNRYNYDNKLGSKEEVDFSCRPTIEYEKNLYIGMYTSHLKMIHRTVFEKVGLFDSNFNGTQDYDISLKIAHYLGDTAFAFLPEAIYYHRVHEKQTTETQNESMMVQTLQLKKNAEIRMKIRDGQYEKKISIIVLSFNKVEQTIECIDAIRRTVTIPYEIIIWDNKSNNKTIDILKEKIEPLPEVTVIYSEKNLGCGGGRRKALTYAKSDYIIFLDNDIVVSDGWLTELIVRLESDEKVAAVNCKVVFPDQKVQINSLHYVVEEPFITFSLGGVNALASDLSTCLWKENDWINGGATIYKKEILESIEGLDEYPNSFEDNEASMQMKEKGYVLLNSPISVVVHNHINYVSTEKVEKEYMEARYNQNNLIISAVVFYRRNGLIINDPYIFRLMGVESQDRIMIQRKFDELI